MSQIAFLCHPTVGHVNTLLAMALQMKEDGHTVRFLIPGGPPLPFRLRPDILNNVTDVPLAVEKQGLEVERLTPALGVIYHAIKLARTHGYPEVRRAQKLFASGLVGTAREIVRRLERRPADALVTDFLFHPAVLAAEKLNVPFASVYHCGLPFRGPDVPPFGSGLPIGQAPGAEHRQAEEWERALLEELRRTLDAGRRALGLPPSAEEPLRTPNSPWLNLVVSHEAIEAPRTGLTDTSFFVGPSFATRRGRAPEHFPFEKLSPEAFKVYVSLGTVFNGRPEVFRAILQALDQPGIQVVVSAGASYPTLAKDGGSERVFLFRRVPQLELLPRMDLVVGHGGNNSTNETLAAGKPLLVIPVGGEQHDNARRVEWLGAGLWLSSLKLTADDVRRAVARLRSEPGFAERARELQRALDETDGAKTSAQLVAHLARHRKPLKLPASAPRTLTRDRLADVLASLHPAT